MGGQLQVPLFLLLSLLPILLQGIQLQDYEIVVGHGNRLVFWSQNHTHNVVVAEPGVKTRIVSILPHLPTNSIYFTTLTKDTAVVSRFFPSNNSSQILFTGLKGSVGSLAFFTKEGAEELLLWANPTNRSVWSLPLSTVNANNTEPKLFFQDPNATFDSIAFHPPTGRLLYTVWRRSNLSEILSYDPTTSSISTLVNNVFQPRGLHVAGNELYWIDNPPGIYFNVEQVTLSQTSGGEVLAENFQHKLLLKGQNQHPYSLVVPCPSSIVWTELMQKVVMSWSPVTETYTTLLPSFNNSPPHGLALLSPRCPITTITPALPSVKPSPTEELATKDAKVGIPSGNKLLEISTCESWEKGRCLNGATCLKYKSTLHCLCATGFTGPRCRDQEGHGALHKDRVEENGESWPSNTLEDITEPEKAQQLQMAVIVLGCLVALLLLLVTGLVIRLQRLNKKPVIRRRVVVSHRSDLDSSPSVCEMIDIENCCNMNVCETPCYERLGSFSGGTSSGSGSCSTLVGGRTRKTSVKEDKKCLLAT